jgi:hypothetical protein
MADDGKSSDGRSRTSRNIHEVASTGDDVVLSLWSRYTFPKTLRRMSLPDDVRRDANFHTESGAIPGDWCCLRLIMEIQIAGQV